MRYWLDTEFIDDGKTIDLISIGIVAEDGREYYAQSVEFDRRKANDWVNANVIPYLKQCTLNPDRHVLVQCRRPDCAWRSPSQIALDVSIFCDPEQYDYPEIWGWCAGYDFVAFCQLFGTMMDIPQGYPHYFKDLQAILDERGISDDELPAQEEGLHNALEDARHLKRLWGYIVRNDCWQ